MNFICFDIGGTKIKYAIMTENFEIKEKSMLDTNAHLGGRHILDTVLTIINDFKKKYELEGVAISTTGVVDPINGVIAYANDIVPNYTGMNITKEIYEKTNLKASLENDANCFALSHVINENDDYFMITVGTGIGGGIVLNKKIYHGFSYTGGEFGTMLFGKDKWEAVASMTALINHAKSLGLPINNGADVFCLYDQGNAIAKEVVDSFYTNLAIGIVSLGQIFNIPKIIIGGGITNRQTFLDELMIKINENKIDPYFQAKIEVSKNTNDGGLIGALVHFKYLYNL